MNVDFSLVHFVFKSVWMLFLITPCSALWAARPETYVLCKSSGIVRTIRVENGQQGCQTTYTKSGVDKVVGQSRSIRSCQGFLANIRDNLENAKWKCRDISMAEITGPQEPSNTQ
jgi:hypothetical protein